MCGDIEHCFREIRASYALIVQDVAVMWEYKSDIWMSKSVSVWRIYEIIEKVFSSSLKRRKELRSILLNNFWVNWILDANGNSVKDNDTRKGTKFLNVSNIFFNFQKNEL